MIHLMNVVDALRVVPQHQGGEAQRIGLPHLAMVRHVSLETEGGHVLPPAVHLVEPDPAKELIGREIEDDQVVPDVHVPVVVDPLRPHDIAIPIQRRVDHSRVVQAD